MLSQRKIIDSFGDQNLFIFPTEQSTPLNVYPSLISAGVSVNNSPLNHQCTGNRCSWEPTQIQAGTVALTEVRRYQRHIELNMVISTWTIRSQNKNITNQGYMDGRQLCLNHFVCHVRFTHHYDSVKTT